MSRRVRKWVFVGLHLIGFVLLWYVIRDLQWDEFLTLMGQLPVWKYLAGIAVLTLVYVLKSLRWKLLTESFGIRISWRDSLVFYLSAGFLSVFTPGRLGEFAKVIFLNKKYRTGISTATSSVFLDRIWDVLVLSMAAFLALVLVIGRLEANLLTILLLGALIAISVVVIVMPSLLFGPLLFSIRRFKNIHHKVENLFIVWNASRFRYFFPSVAISAGAFLMLAALPVLLSAGTCCSISYGRGIAAISISNILSFLPITVAGFGTRELVFTEIWALDGYSKEAALMVSTGYFMITYLGSLTLGGIVYLFNIGRLYRPAEIIKLSAKEDRTAMTV